MTETTMNLQNFVEQYIVYPWANFRPLDILDWLLMTLLFYFVYMLFHGRVAARVGGGLLAILLISVAAEQFGMSGLHSIMSAIMPYTVILLAVIYQPELRDALARIGYYIMLYRKKNRNDSELDNTIHVVADAACQIAQSDKNGALIVLELFQRVDEHIDKGYSLDIDVDRNTLCKMFEDRTLFHDGAVVIRNNRIIMAGGKLPLHKNGEAVNGLGTRHRAAVGITNVTDCVVVVVSEETHKISIANHGNIERDFNQSGEELKNPEVRQRVEKNLRRVLSQMLIGLDYKDLKGSKDSNVQIRFKWGFNLDAEDRERIIKEREKKNMELEKFQKNYNKNQKKNDSRPEDDDNTYDTPSKVEVVPADPSEENVGMPSIALIPTDLRSDKRETDTDASDEV